MNEIYWITRLDGLLTLFIILTALSFIGTIVFLINFSDVDCHKNREDHISGSKKYFKLCLVYIVSFFMLSVLTPSTKSAFLIFGIGGTIDYIKSNDKAMQIPSKVIDALDVWVDGFSDDSTDSEK